jgi:hypothetical protein
MLVVIAQKILTNLVSKPTARFPLYDVHWG